MRKGRVDVDLIAYSAVISACEKGGEWRKAAGLMADMLRHSCEPDGIVFNAVVSACEKSAEWLHAIGLLGVMQRMAIATDLVTFSAAISACAKSAVWQHALCLFAEMLGARLEPDLIVCSSLISACEKGAQWLTAFSLLAFMADSEVQSSTVSFSAAISSCEKCCQWTAAVDILDAIGASSVESNAIARCAVISAGEKGRQWSLALGILTGLRALDARRSGGASDEATSGEVGPTCVGWERRPTYVAYSSAITACETLHEWRWALQLLHDMLGVGLKPSGIQYGTVASALKKASLHGRARSLLEGMRPSWMQSGKLAEACHPHSAVAFARVTQAHPCGGLVLDVLLDRPGVIRLRSHLAWIPPMRLNCFSSNSKPLVEAPKSVVHHGSTC